MENWQKFMLESNRIEGEDRLNPGDKDAFDCTMSGITVENDILVIHRLLTQHLHVSWSGVYRNCNVRVGSYVAPIWQKVPSLMKKYILNFPEYNAYQAYCEFEKIHSFRDFNGRTGR